MHEVFARAEKLLMRIRSLKWHATTTLASLHDKTAREEATAIVGDLEALEESVRAPSPTSDTLTADEQRADALGLRLSKLGPG